MLRGSGSRAASRTVAAIALATALAACPSGDGGEGSGPGRPGERPQKGGEVVVAYPHEPATLNPFVTGGDAPPTRDLTRLLWPGLYRLGPKGVRSPWLLAREPAASDVGGSPFSVRVRLRSDAVWSDGTPITANDLRFTWQVATTSPGIASRDGYDRITDVAIEDEKTARVVFAEPYARWRDLFSAGLGVLPAHALGTPDVSKALARSWPVSGGPYVLASWTPGLEIVLDRNPRAWGGEPLLDRIRIQFVPDPATALQLFRRGAVDVLGPYSGIEMARRAADAVENAQVSGDRGATWVGLYLNTRVPELADVRVRQALAMAIDRAAIVEGLVREQGARLDAPTGTAEARATASFSRYGFDPAGAESRLDAAGWQERSGGPRRRGRTDLSVTLASVGADELSQRVLRALNLQAGAVGIELNIVSLDADRLWGSWLQSGRFEAALLMERDPPGGSLRGRFGSAWPHNISRIEDAALISALEQADVTFDDADPVVDGPSERIAELVPVIPLYVLEATLAARPGIREVIASAAADGFLWNAHRWWRVGGSSSPSPTPTPSPTPS